MLFPGVAPPRPFTAASTSAVLGPRLGVLAVGVERLDEETASGDVNLDSFAAASAGETRVPGAAHRQSSPSSSGSPKRPGPR